MEGDGGAGAGARATAWDLGMHCAPASSAYPQHFLPQPGGPSRQQQQMQQELISLKLGKRPCCLAGSGGGKVAQGGEGHVHGNGVGGGTAAGDGKRKEKAAVAAVPRCQVEGCHMALAGAKEYHRRHKVCEAHSKAPRVIVHGAEQRFCQQCSRSVNFTRTGSSLRFMCLMQSPIRECLSGACTCRFHAMSEFDDAKRSCRRRLAGHNERRRKSNACEAMDRGSAHTHGVTSLVHGFPPYGAVPTSPAGALSLLSSARAAPWLIPPPDMVSARSSSSALDELIAENRAALLACHFFPERSAGRPMVPAEIPGWQQQVHAAPPGHAHAHAGNGVGRHVQDHEAPPAGHVTLDLMQAPTTTGAAFRPMPDRAARPAEDGDDAGRSSDVWTPLEGAHVV